MIYIGIIAVIVAVLCLVCYLWTRSIVKKFVFRNPGDLGIEYGEGLKKMQQVADAWSKENPEEFVSVESGDGLKLVAHWWDRKQDLTILFVHGYGNTGTQATLVASAFIDGLQANILAPDCRASGASEGEWIGFGWPDRLDVLKWIEYIIQLKGENHKIVLFGISMGASTVLSAAGEQLPANVRAVCSDCGYSSLSKLFKYIIRHTMHVPAPPVLFVVDMLFKKWFGYSIYTVNPIDQVRKAKIPILFIHGEDDQFIPSSMAKELYEACTMKKELLLVPKATHALSAIIEWDNYCRTIESFCKSAIEQNEIG